MDKEALAISKIPEFRQAIEALIAQKEPAQKIWETMQNYTRLSNKSMLDAYFSLSSSIHRHDKKVLEELIQKFQNSPDCLPAIQDLQNHLKNTQSKEE